MSWSTVSDLEDKLAPLRQRFLERLRGNLPALLALREDLEDEIARMELIAAAHKIAGMAGTMGYPELGAAARMLEEGLVYRPGETTMARADIDKLTDCIRALIGKD